MLARENVVQPMAAHECAQTAAMLARAFRDNPGMVAVLKGDGAARRAESLSAILLGFVAATHRYGSVEVVKRGESVVAAALAFPPGRFPPPLGFELEGPVFVRLHFIHSRSDRFDVPTSKCSTCHLAPESTRRASNANDASADS